MRLFPTSCFASYCENWSKKSFSIPGSITKKEPREQTTINDKLFLSHLTLFLEKSTYSPKNCWCLRLFIQWCMVCKPFVLHYYNSNNNCERGNGEKPILALTATSLNYTFMHCNLSATSSEPHSFFLLRVASYLEQFCFPRIFIIPISNRYGLLPLDV